MPSQYGRQSQKGKPRNVKRSVLIPPSLRDVLGESILPGVKERGVERFLLAQPKLADMHLPPDMHAVPRKRRGRGNAVHGGKQQVLTRWPEDNMISLRLPYCCFVFSGEADFRI